MTNLFKKFYTELKDGLMKDVVRLIQYNVRHINPVKIHAERIMQKNEELVNNLDYDELNFLYGKTF